MQDEFDDYEENQEIRENILKNTIQLEFVSKSRSPLVPVMQLAAKNSKFSTLEEAKFYYKEQVREENKQVENKLVTRPKKYKDIFISGITPNTPPGFKNTEKKTEKEVNITLPKFSKNMQQKMICKKDEQVTIRCVGDSKSTQMLQLLYESAKTAVLNGHTNIRVVIDSK